MITCQILSFKMSTPVVEVKVETPFTSGAKKSGDSVDFWKSYVQSRPSPDEEFFELINEYHLTHGDSRNEICHDVGTGPGNIAARLASYFQNIVGSDVNADVLAAAPHIVPAEVLKRMKFVLSPAETLPENTPAEHGEQGTTDIVTVSECMPLLDAPAALKSFHTLLRPGGTLGIYFYGPAIFVDGDVDKCNAAYDKVATSICSFNQPMKGTPGFPFHLRGAEALESYMDNIALPTEDWENVERYKWNCDYPLLFNSKEGFDFDFHYTDRRAESEVTKEIIDRNVWSADWDIKNVEAYLDSVYPNYRIKAGSRYSEVETMLEELNEVMGGGKRKVTFSLVLILATKKAAVDQVSSNDNLKAHHVRLTPSHPGLGRVIKSPPGALEKANELLQKNHDNFHIFWRDANGHNHVAHSILTTYALGGSPAEIERAYNDGAPVQRSKPASDNETIKTFSDESQLYMVFGVFDQYTNVLRFMEQEINRVGWKAVVHKYCFSRTKLADIILSRMYEGAYHPIIHLGLGIEFEQPSIIAEALAQAIIHDSTGIPDCLLRTDLEVLKSDSKPERKSLLELFSECRADDVIRTAPRLQDGPLKMKNGVLGRSRDEITSLAAQFCCETSQVEERAAEVINCNVYLAGAAQRQEKIPKIDFFHMHAVTSSIFVTVLLQQNWISQKDKARIVEWKGRTDILWYAASGCAQLLPGEIDNYKAGASAGMDWNDIYRAVTAEHDDGHVAKFVRAVRSAQEVSAPYEQTGGASFPVKGDDAWLNLARMTYDSTLRLSDEAKWVWAAGFPAAWASVPARQ